MKKLKKKKPLSNLAAKYNNFIRNKIPTRIHMSIILVTVSFTGTLTSKLLFEFGIHTLSIRYFLTAISCYVFFLIYIKLWLIYINPGKNSSRSADNIDLSGIDIDGSFPTGGSSATEVIGQGGNFGGAVASSSFVGNIGMPIQPMSVSSETDSSFSDLGSALDIDGDAAGPILIIIAVGAVVIAIFGGGIFIIYQAPSIMSDVAFEALLASGFLKSTRDISAGNWIGSIIKRTYIPFGIITLVATLSGWIIGYFCPIATRILDIQFCI